MYQLIRPLFNQSIKGHVLSGRQMQVTEWFEFWATSESYAYTVYHIPPRVNIFLRHDIIRLHGCILILSGITFEIQNLNHEKKAEKFSVLFLHCLLNVTNNQNQRQTCPSNSGSNELGLGRLCPLMHQQTVLRFASWFCCLQNLNQNPSRVLVFKKRGNKSP